MTGCQSSPEKRKLNHYNKGIEYLQKGDFQSAILEFKNAVTLDQTFADAHYQLGLAYWQLEEFDKAVIEFGYVTSYAPQNLDAHLYVAKYYARHKHDYEKAQEELTILQQDFPENSLIYAMLGEVYLAQERLEMAIEALQRSLNLDPTLVQSGVSLSRIYLQLNQPAQAQSTLEMLIRNNPEHPEPYLAMGLYHLETRQFEAARQYYEQAVQLDKQNIVAYLGLAETALSLQDADTAVNQLELLNSNYEGEIPFEMSLRIRLIRGRAFLLKQHYLQAVSELQQVTQYVPGLLLGHYSLGLAHDGLGNHEQAISAYSNALKIRPDHVPSLLKIALTHYRLGHLEDAQQYVQEVLDIDAMNIDAHDLLGVIYTRTTRYNEALEEFAFVEQHAPDFPHLPLHKATTLLYMQRLDEAIQEIQAALGVGYQQAELYIQLAKAYMSKNLPQDAIAAYLQAIDIDPTAIPAYTGLANLYVGLHQPEKAEETLNSLLPEHADLPDVQYALGRIYYEQQRYKEAETQLKQVLISSPNSADAHYMLARVYTALQQVIDAEEEYARVLQVTPNHVPSLLNMAYLKLQDGFYTAALDHANRVIALEPGNTAALDILLTAYTRTAQYDEAIKLIEQLKTSFPDSPAIYLGLGLIYLNQGDFDQALASAQHAIQLDPDNSTAYDVMGRAYLGKQDIEQAQLSFHTALELDPQSVDSYVKLGQIDVLQQRYFEAIRRFQQALRIRPTDSEALIELGKIYQLQQRTSDAVAIFERVPENSPNASLALEALVTLYSQQEDLSGVISRALKLLKLQSDNHRVRYLLGQAYTKRGNNNEAILQFREVMLLAPDFVIAQLALGYIQLFNNRLDDAAEQFIALRDHEELSTEALIGSALVHQLQKQYTQAIRDMQAALSQKPGDATLHLLLGNIYVSQKSFDKAADQFQRIEEPSVLERHTDELQLRTWYGEYSGLSATQYNIAIISRDRRWFSFTRGALSTSLWRNPENPLLHYALGSLHLQGKRYNNAQKSFEKALEFGPSFPYIHKTLGDLYRQQQRLDKAVQEYITYLEHASDDIPTRLLLGLMYEQQGNKEQALASYQACLETDPEHVLALNQLAWFYAEQGEQFDEALSLAQKAVALQPSPGIIDTLGWVHYKRGQYAEAAQQFQTALEHVPFQVTITYHLGLAYYHQGWYEDARRIFENVLELSSDFEHADEIRQLLSTIEETFLTPASAENNS